MGPGASQKKNAAMRMENVVIAAGVRTPVGRYGGCLRQVPVHELGAVVLNEAVR